MGDQVTHGALFEIAGDPSALGPGKEGVDLRLVVVQGAVVEVGGVLHVAGIAGRIQLEIQHALGDRAAFARWQQAGVLDGVFGVEEHAGLGARVPVVDEDCPAAEQVAVDARG